MTVNNICLTPNISEKLDSFRTKSDEALFSIELRLNEIALLIPLKKANIVQIRKRMASMSASVRLERELAEQQEQINDLSQLAEDWLNIAELITQNPNNLSDLSEPIKRLLRSLGIQTNRSTPINNSGNSIVG